LEEGVSDWLILRCSGRNTLPLADSLNRAGFECWTPVEVETRRVLRSRSRIEVRKPLTAHYVFARASHVDDLCRLSTDPLSRHPRFSIARRQDNDGIALIHDKELDPLRFEEQRASHRHQAKQAPRSFDKGQTVTTRAAGFAGMSGIVERAKGKYVFVLFDGKEVKVASFLLQPTDIRQAA
jgi:hypothetical protein